MPAWRVLVCQLPFEHCFLPGRVSCSSFCLPAVVLPTLAPACLIYTNPNFLATIPTPYAFPAPYACHRAAGSQENLLPAMWVRCSQEEGYCSAVLLNMGLFRTHCMELQGSVPQGRSVFLFLALLLEEEPSYIHACLPQNSLPYLGGGCPWENLDPIFFPLLPPPACHACGGGHSGEHHLPALLLAQFPILCPTHSCLPTCQTGQDRHLSCHAMVGGRDASVPTYLLFIYPKLPPAQHEIPDLPLTCLPYATCEWSFFLPPPFHALCLY